jgi:hypothetical protein
LPKELPVPIQAQRDARAINMASVWIAEKGLHCSLNIGIYEDNPNIGETKAWGILLADIARHVSSGVAESRGQVEVAALLEQLRDAFLDELSSPTSNVTGTFVAVDGRQTPQD